MLAGFVAALGGDVCLPRKLSLHCMSKVQHFCFRNQLSPNRTAARMMLVINHLIACGWYGVGSFLSLDLIKERLTPHIEKEDMLRSILVVCNSDPACSQPR